MMQAHTAGDQSVLYLWTPATLAEVGANHVMGRKVQYMQWILDKGLSERKVKKAHNAVVS